MIEFFVSKVKEKAKEVKTMKKAPADANCQDRSVDSRGLEKKDVSDIVTIDHFISIVKRKAPASERSLGGGAGASCRCYIT